MMLQGCASTKSINVAPAPAPQLTQADSALLKDCEPPVVIPKGGNNEKLWRKDRISLVECGRSKKALGEYYVGRDNALRKTTK